ncbi:MAG: DUF559 domain-containing protein [Anaeromyxobacteraceae bacterium]
MRRRDHEDRDLSILSRPHPASHPGATISSWAIPVYPRSTSAAFRPYTLDFYCLCLQLAVEVDGSQHRDDAGLRYDAERDAALAAAGIKVLRFTNQEALAATESVAIAILDEVERLTAIRPKPTIGRSRRRDRLAPSP